uniref:H15 domain-containing protein n=1 Tax=Canis lupus familiaris TaxID=9615 RepID=A0A8C0TU60_CANLF
MSETAPAAPAAAPPAEKAPVKKKAAKKPAGARRKASGPPVSELITKAVAASKERSGVSLAALKKALAAAGYDVEKNNSRIKLGLKSLVSKGTLVQTKGTGASGSFKLNKKAASGEAKPKAKKAGAAKPKRAAGTAKKPKKAAGTGTPKKSAKKTPKKAKKPAAATVAKKVAKSPKKAKAAKPKKAAKSAAKAVKPKSAKPKVTKPKKAAPKKNVRRFFRTKAFLPRPGFTPVNTIFPLRRVQGTGASGDWQLSSSIATVTDLVVNLDKVSRYRWWPRVSAPPKRIRIL